MRFRNYNGFRWFPYKIILLLYLIYTPFWAIAGAQITETFHIDGIEQGIFLPVTINDLGYTLLVDTGATFTVLDSSFKPLLGKPLKSGQAETINGNTKIKFFKPVDIYAGEQNLTSEHNFLLSDFEILNKVAGIEFHGVLGMANLYNHVWDMNFDKKLLTIRSHSTGETNFNEFKKLKITPDKVGIPTIPGVLGNKKINFLIDSGDNGFGRVRKEIIDTLIEKNLVTSVATDSIVSISGLAEIRRIRLKEVKVGDNVYKNIVMRESLQNALGIGFLKKHHVIFDFPRKKFFFKKGLGVFQVEREDKSGLKLISHNNQIVVALADVRGPAAKAGIKKGDVIVQLNDSPISGKDLLKLRNFLKGNDGDEILLGINRLEENIIFRFTLEKGFDFVAF